MKPLHYYLLRIVWESLVRVVHIKRTQKNTRVANACASICTNLKSDKPATDYDISMSRCSWLRFRTRHNTLETIARNNRWHFISDSHEKARRNSGELNQNPMTHSPWNFLHNTISLTYESTNIIVHSGIVESSVSRFLLNDKHKVDVPKCQEMIRASWRIIYWPARHSPILRTNSTPNA